MVQASRWRSFYLIWLRKPHQLIQNEAIPDGSRDIIYSCLTKVMNCMVQENWLNHTIQIFSTNVNER